MYIILGSLAVLCVLSAASVAVATSGSVVGVVDPDYYRKSDEAAYAASLMSKILQDTRQSTELIRILQSLVRQKGLHESNVNFMDDLGAEAIKREAAWDMDYGWGGGRFGKRMDSLGIAGRFGRSVNSRPEDKIRRSQ